MSDTSDLVERLQNRLTTHCSVQPTHLHMPNYSEGRKLLEEAATALTAKDKEIEELRDDLSTLSEFVKKSECLRYEALNDARYSEERAETAERERDCHKQMADKNYALWAEVSRERDEAKAALKPFARYSVGAIFEDEKFDYRVHVCCSMEDQPQFKHFDAARAVEQGDKP